MDINVIIASTIGLFVITLLLVTMLLVAKERLLPSGPVKLVINGEKDVEVSSGDTLLTTLGNNKIFLHRHQLLLLEKIHLIRHLLYQ